MSDAATALLLPRDQNPLQKTIQNRRDGALQTARNIQGFPDQTVRGEAGGAAHDLPHAFGASGMLALRLRERRQPLVQRRGPTLQLLGAALRILKPLLRGLLLDDAAGALDPEIIAAGPRGGRPPLEIGGLGAQPLELRARFGRLDLDARARLLGRTELLLKRRTGPGRRRQDVEVPQKLATRLHQQPIALFNDGGARRPIVLDIRERGLRLRQKGRLGRRPPIEILLATLVLRVAGRELLPLPSRRLDPLLQIARLLLRRPAPRLQPIDLDVEEMDLLAEQARGRLPFFQLQPQRLELGIGPRQSGARGRFLILKPREPPEGGAAIVVQRAQPADRDRGAPLAQALLEASVASRLGSLPLERLDLLLDFRGDVRKPQQIGLRRLELLFGLAPFRLVAEDPGRLLDDGAPILRLRGEDLIDLSLLNRGVESGADLGARQKILDVLQTAALAVEHVLALAGTVEAAGDHDALGDLFLKEAGRGGRLRGNRSAGGRRPFGERVRRGAGGRIERTGLAGDRDRHRQVGSRVGRCDGERDRLRGTVTVAVP